jgi:hypothetical protein
MLGRWAWSRSILLVDVRPRIKRGKTKVAADVVQFPQHGTPLPCNAAAALISLLLHRQAATHDRL